MATITMGNGSAAGVVAHAQALGVDAASVQTVSLELSALRQAGTLVDVEIKGLSLLFKRTNWDELGISTKNGDKRAKRFTPGAKALYPEAVYRPFQSLDTRIRANLKRHSYDVQGFAPWFYVPVTSFAKWHEQHERLVGLFEQHKATTLANYDGIVAALREDFADVAEHALVSLVAADPNHPTTQLWKDELVQRAVGQLPSRDEFAARLHVTWKTAMIADRAAVLDEQIQIKQQEIALSNLNAEQQAILAMREFEAQRIREQLAQMASPFQQVMDQLGSQIYNDVKEILGLIQKNGYLPGGTAQRARGLQELYKLMAICPMPELEHKLALLGQALDAAPVAPRAATGAIGLNYESSGIKAALLDLAAVTHENAQAVKAVSPSVGAALDL